MSRLTTHVLDTSNGLPAEGMVVRLYRRLGTGDIQKLAETSTNAQGRTDQPLLEGAAFETGEYQLEYSVADYFRGLGLKLPEPPFLDVVSLRFGVHDTASHYHVPLLVSPYGYSTYRGS